MNDLDRELVFSQTVKAGKRIYYFDVKQSRNGDRYISITESKKIVEGSFENQRVSFEKHKLFLYKEDYAKFVGALIKTLEVAKSGVVPVEEEQTGDSSNVENVIGDTEEPVETVTVQPAAEPEPAVEETKEIVQETKAVVSETAKTEEVSESDAFKIDLDF